MEVKNPHYRQVIEAGFKGAAFVNDIGITLLDCGPGWCESSVTILPRHLQHGGLVHAGVQSTIADHTAGAAATTILAQGQFVVTAEFKINLLRAAKGDSLFCRAQVLKPGKLLIVVEAEVFVVSGTTKDFVSKTTATMSVMTLRP
ncbi:MAG: PaaI family thioesterase [Syntrophales bacterium]|jgi:uncharacterized protein (TIGR00369 family)